MITWMSSDGISWNYYPRSRMWFGTVNLGAAGGMVNMERTVAEFRYGYPEAPPLEGRARIWASLPQRGLIWYRSEPHWWQNRHPL